jgi:hypothetical protein
MKSVLRQISLLTLFAIFGIVTANPAMAEKTTEIYKWVDKDGRTHYAARPGSDNAKKMHLGSNIFHSTEKKTNKIVEDSKQREERNKLCNDSKELLAKYKNAPFLYRFDDEKKQKVRLTQAETKDAFLQAEKDVSYWCNPPTKTAVTEPEPQTEPNTENQSDADSEPEAGAEDI